MEIIKNGSASMRVLHINSYYSTSRFYKNLYDKQVRDGIGIDVFVPVPTSHIDNNFDYGEYTKVSESYSKYDRAFFHIKNGKILRGVIKNFKVDNYSLIHAHSLFTNGYIAYKLKEKYNTPYIVAVRNTDVNVFFKKMIHLRNLGVNILKSAEYIIFLSDSYKKLVINNYIPSKDRSIIERKIRVIPNGIDHFWFRNKFDRKENPLKQTEKVRILQVGDINRNKNQSATVQAIKLLIDEGYKIKYTIVGNVKDNEIFNKITSEKFVDYIPPLPKERLLEVYRNNDIFVMPSITETFGLVYAEAMSQGLPIIYTKNQGFDGQFYDGEVGYSVNCFDKENIKDRLIQVIKNHQQISSDNIHRCQKFDWKEINNQYIELYKRMI
ncbi:glycosyltransferase family 4 protein [Bacillus sp. SD088]|uniref:glycosyltransferase family 4 protein n=1 Tax=Bacillus sp. SD088 TaxID=2782012 RepID=UPI001A96A949|nr:glycosyltransferase family 4 protein [Bacillus sp. SD088]MBO0991442.1 glycosyltransferase family 4 protein [Bacillus sp. SD088]